MLSHLRDWMATLGAGYPPGPVLEQLTAPTPGVRHVLHRASAPTELLTHDVLDLALEPLRLLYLQADIPPAGTSNHLTRLGLQRCVKAAHAGGVVEQWLALHNPFTAQGHWYLHQLLFPLGRPRSTTGRTRTTRTQSAWARGASHSRPRPPSQRGRARRRCCRGLHSTRPPW